MTPLVLVENERNATKKYNDWNDVTGVRYHFPNRYKNRIVTGTPFVYYRGSHRKGKKRGTPEYFGCGVIGKIKLDEKIPPNSPKRKRKWFCEILDYLQFKKPVLAKQRGRYVEKIEHENLWGVGVRKIDVRVYNRILKLAGLVAVAPEGVPHSLSMTNIDDVEIPSEPQQELLLLPQTQTTKNEGGAGRSAKYYSKFSKEIGDRAEAIVYQYFKIHKNQYAHSQLRWVSRDGETPGWDIEFIDTSRKLTAIEVKGTRESSFSSLELTQNEWKAAEIHREQYWLVLVAECLGNSPKIQVVKNPAKLVDSSDLILTPTRWRLAKLA